MQTALDVQIFSADFVYHWVVLGFGRVGGVASHLRECCLPSWVIPVLLLLIVRWLKVLICIFEMCKSNGIRQLDASVCSADCLIRK